MTSLSRPKKDQRTKTAAQERNDSCETMILDMTNLQHSLTRAKKECKMYLRTERIELPSSRDFKLGEDDMATTNDTTTPCTLEVRRTTVIVCAQLMLEIGQHKFMFTSNFSWGG